MSQARIVLRATLLSVAAVALVVFGFGMLLAKSWRVESERTLRGDAKQVGALVRDLSTWSRWVALRLELGPQTAREVQGEAGSGTQRIVWTGPLGKAVLTATAVTESSLDYTVAFEFANAPSPGTGRVEWRPDGTGCQVRWIDGADYESLLRRWFGWFGALQERVKQVHSSTLEALQRELEQAPAAK
jgi:hypothetical protein